jgi:hypothetical protein
VNGISFREDSCGLVNQEFLSIKKESVAGRGVRPPLVSIGREVLIDELQRGGITHENRLVLRESI